MVDVFRGHPHAQVDFNIRFLLFTKRYFNEIQMSTRKTIRDHTITSLHQMELTKKSNRMFGMSVIASVAKPENTIPHSVSTEDWNHVARRYIAELL